MGDHPKLWLNPHVQSTSFHSSVISCWQIVCICVALSLVQGLALFSMDFHCRSPSLHVPVWTSTGRLRPRPRTERGENCCFYPSNQEQAIHVDLPKDWHQLATFPLKISIGSPLSHQIAVPPEIIKKETDVSSSPFPVLTPGQP